MQNKKFNGKNHVVQKNTFFKNFTRSSSFCRIKVNPKKIRKISFKFRKSDKVCCTPDYTATTTSSATAATSQVRGKFNKLYIFFFFLNFLRMNATNPEGDITLKLFRKKKKINSKLIGILKMRYIFEKSISKLNFLNDFPLELI